jgi:cell fate regulator YaaT (PSP1 superfamily)
LDEFQPVSIKMAKEQGLSLNPVKISGTCGRLMCCLKYEQDAYEHLLKITPKTGALVKAPDGKGHVVDANMLTGAVKVQLNDEMVPRVYARNDIKVIRDGHIKVEKSEKEAFKGLEK